MMTDTANEPTPPQDDFPTLWGSLGWVALFLVLQIIAGVAALGIAIGLDQSGRSAMELARDLGFVAMPTVLSLIASSLVMLGLFWLHLGKEDRAARIGLMRWSRLSPLHTILLAVGLIALGLAFNYLYANYVIPDIKVQESLRKMFAALPATGLNKAMLFIAVAGIAPLLEELLFRGFVQNALAEKLPIWGAILGASAIFAAVHMDYHAFPALMAMGVVFGLLYHKTGSLRVNIVAHMINNGAALLLT
ncbi:MAG: CPBP family intramembrane metalloprotease [Sphingomonadaceae bacterium]|jgi:membrane protease YdiL (CAAX protease family)|nr:CPBP family intramembrane metalloprotease [Sphingomonadaceae bacterium]